MNTSISLASNKPVLNNKFPQSAAMTFKNDPMMFELAVMELDIQSEQASMRVDYCKEKNQSSLDLSGCNISHIPENLLSFLTKLTDLNLSNNRLRELPLSELQSLKSLRTLDIRGNPDLNISVADIHDILPKVNVLLDNASVSPDSVVDQSVDLEGGGCAYKPPPPPQFAMGTTDKPIFSRKLEKRSQNKNSQGKNLKGASTSLKLSNTLRENQIPNAMSQSNAPVFKFGNGAIVWP